MSPREAAVLFEAETLGVLPLACVALGMSLASKPLFKRAQGGDDKDKCAAAQAKVEFS